jgi:hypothetical protein
MSCEGAVACIHHTSDEENPLDLKVYQEWCAELLLLAKMWRMADKVRSMEYVLTRLYLYIFVKRASSLNHRTHSSTPSPIWKRLQITLLLVSTAARARAREIENNFILFNSSSLSPSSEMCALYPMKQLHRHIPCILKKQLITIVNFTSFARSTTGQMPALVKTKDHYYLLM